jgi:small-conductance mechanosensitive channel
MLSAALGWALQRPITGVAAWIIIVTRRPFEIGDRVMIGDVKGDVEDITLAHIHLKEIGGKADSDEPTGRVVLIPCATLFDKNIINYTAEDEFVLDEVVVTVTYESDLDKAMDICLGIVNRNAGKNGAKTKPYLRTFFQPNGIDVHVRFFSSTVDIKAVVSKITQEIHKEFKKHKEIQMAYPHTEIIYKSK